MYQSLIIVDDFYPNPEEVRQTALSCEYPEMIGPPTFPGRNSRQKFVRPGLDQAISQVLGDRVAGGDVKSTHCRFRITLAADTSRYQVHADPTALNWVGVVYLNLPEQCHGGTAFFRHKGLNSDRTPLTPEELAAYGPSSVAELMRQEGNDPDKWEHTMTVPMRFNRLAIYRPWLWHSSCEAFGSSIEDGRLIQLVAFKTQQGAAGRPD